MCFHNLLLLRILSFLGSKLEGNRIVCCSFVGGGTALQTKGRQPIMDWHSDEEEWDDRFHHGQEALVRLSFYDGLYLYWLWTRPRSFLLSAVLFRLFKLVSPHLLGAFRRVRRVLPIKRRPLQDSRPKENTVVAVGVRVCTVALTVVFPGVVSAKCSRVHRDRQHGWVEATSNMCLCLLLVG